jgi:hypothetical protein
MRSVAIVLCLAVFGLNAEAALLHVHEGDHLGDHHHGPAAHEHRIKVELPPVDAELEATDDDSSAVPVAVVKATGTQSQHIVATSVVVVKTDAPRESRTPRFVVTSRAHAPPSGRPRSLRAPPRSIQP